MKISAGAGAVIAAAALLASLANAANIERGRRLFSDPSLAGSTTAASCNTCHPDGKKLGKNTGKNSFVIKGKTAEGLSEAINLCIEHRMRGKALEPASRDLEDLVTYVRSLRGATPFRVPRKRQAATGC